MPGDKVISATFVATRAITIDASRDQIWPLIEQMGNASASVKGFGRIATCSADALDAAPLVVLGTRIGERPPDASSPGPGSAGNHPDPPDTRRGWRFTVRTMLDIKAGAEAAASARTGP
jgi:hypothetical protein